MATQPEMNDAQPDEAIEETETRVTLLDVISAGNVVQLLSESDVARIGSAALAEYEIDKGTCKEFHERYDRAMDMAMQVRKEKTFPWPNASNVIYPLLTQAAVQFHARALPAIIDGGKVVKGKVLGHDPEGQKRSRADRIADHMTWQFLNDVPGWEDDTDKLLLQLPIVGCVFRKTWRDTIRDQNNSETVTAKDLVVNYKTVSFDKAPRFTHVQRYYPHEIEAFIRAGEWVSVPYDGEDGSDPHSLVEIYEQHRLIDLDGDGLPEPYVVTMTSSGAVARIAACFDLDGVFVASDLFGGQMPLTDAIKALQQAHEIPEGYTPDIRVVRIERREYFTKYGFIPAPDGSFYDIGFGTLTENLGAAINTIINQLIDAGTLANMQGGFLSGGTKIKGGSMRFTPGEWKRVEGITSGPLRDNILPLQLPGPNAALFQLLGMLIESAQGITSVSDIMTGNQESQTAPTTALALIEQGQKVFTAIYARVHRSLGCEIKIMHQLNRDFVNEEQYFALSDNPEVVGKADYEDRDLDVMPVSDPRAINDQAKMARAQVLMAHNGDPLVNQEVIRRREFEAAGIDNIPELLEVPQLPPPPEAMQAEAAMANDKARADADVRAKDATTVKTLIEAASAAYAFGATLGDANMQAQSMNMIREAQSLADTVWQEMENGGQPVDEPGGLPALAGSPDDAGVPGLPEGLPGPDGIGMGAGGADVPAGPDTGGSPVGPGIAGM